MEGAAGNNCENLLGGWSGVWVCSPKGRVDRTGQTNPSHKNSNRISVHFLSTSMEDKRGQTRACPQSASIDASRLLFLLGRGELLTQQCCCLQRCVTVKHACYIIYNKSIIILDAEIDKMRKRLS